MVTAASEAFRRLEHFIERDMRMSHIYQPVMLIELLRRQGRATVDQIASALLSHDRAQLDYYRQITKQMVGDVLTKRRRISNVIRVEAETGHQKGSAPLR